MRFRSHSNRPTLLGRLSAWTGVALVVLLAWLAADPAAHAWLHDNQDRHDSGTCAGHHHQHGSLPDDDDACVITQFAQGHFDLVLAPAGITGAMAQRNDFVARPLSILVSRVEHCLPPGCGPPVA